MKKILLIAVAAFCLVSCKKNDITPSPHIVGKWEITRVYGGFIEPPHNDSVYKAGNGNILQLNADSTYKQSFNGQAHSGIYHIRKSDMFHQKYFSYELLFDGDTNINDGSAIILTGDKLTLSSLIPDVGSIDYQKIQN